MKTECQKKKILKHLKKGRNLTSLGALNLFGCMRLASRVGELKDEGHPINAKWVKGYNGKRVKQYYYEL